LNEPYTKKIVNTDTKALQGVTFSVNDEMRYSTAALVRTEGFSGQVCRTKGTLGTLVGVTATVTSGSQDITDVTPGDGIKVGDIITIGGSAALRVISRTDAN